MIKLVKCIDNGGTVESETTLLVGAIYEVTDEFILGVPYYRLNGVRCAMQKGRFVDVNNEQPERQAEPRIIATKAIDPNVDHEEERCRSVLLGPSKGCCPCNVPMKDCNFHS
jgi:hypothetical protein